MTWTRLLRRFALIVGCMILLTLASPPVVRLNVELPRPVVETTEPAPEIVPSSVNVM